MLKHLCRHVLGWTSMQKGNKTSHILTYLASPGWVASSLRSLYLLKIPVESSLGI